VEVWAEGLQQHLLQGSGQRLAGLIHHAGAMGLGKWTPTADGEETQWAMNFSGPFRLTRRLWDTLLEDGTKVVCLTSTSHCAPNTALDLSLECFEEDTYQGWGAFQQSKLAALLFSNQLDQRLAAAGSSATSCAVCESDKWFYHPQLLTPDDKADLTAGPATTLSSLASTTGRGCYWVDGAVGTAGEHGLSEDDALCLWELSVALDGKL